MTLLGSVDIPFTKSTKIAVDATDTAGQAETVAQQATDTAGQAQVTAQTASQTATQAAATAADAAKTAQIAITTANGKNKAYYGATTPTSPQSGDIWFVEDSSGNVTAIKHYDGAQWVTDVDNDALVQQINAAKATADHAATVGQTAQQVAQQAAQVGESAAKTATEAQQAANEAKTDAADAVTKANNAVNTANKATQDAQNAIDKAQDGFDAAQDALSKAGTAVDTANTAKQVATEAQTDAEDAVAKADNAVNTSNQANKNAQNAIEKAQESFDEAQTAFTVANNATDTANTAKQVASDAATQASTAKTNAQTAMSNAQDAINKANAANANANTREKAIIKSNTAPSNPATDQLWIDTSTTPQIMRRWNGSAWVDLSPTQASQIGAVSTITYTTDITNINNTLSQKASVETVNTLSGRVDKAETAITQNANKIELKADKSIVDTLKNTVDNHSTLISQNADAIQLKADKSTVDTLSGRVSTAEATLTTHANEIAARITKTEADDKYATQTALTATANSLTSNISAVQTNLDNLQVGGRNYWVLSSLSNGCIGSDGGVIYTGLDKNIPLTPIPNGFKSIILTIYDHIEAPGNACLLFYDANESPVGTYYYSVNPMFSDDGNYPKSAIKSIPSNAVYFRASFYKPDGKKIKVEFGSKPTDWSPAPEDMATVVQFNTLQQTLDSTTSRIGNAEGNISALQQTANSFATRISNAEKDITSLTQTAQGLQTQVTNNKNDIATVTQTASALQTRITNAEGNISALQQTSDSFATRISNTEGNITTLTQTVSGLQTTVSEKVDKTTYNSFVTQTSQALQSKLSVQDAANTYATQSQLTQTASSLQSSITQIQSSGNNLVIDPSLEINGNTSEKYHSGSKSLKVVANGYIQDIPLMTVTTSGGRMFYAEVWVLAGQSSWDGVVGLQVSEYNSRTDSWNWTTIQDLPANGGQTWTKLSGYVTVPDGYDTLTIRLSVRDSVTNGAVFYFDDAFVTEVSGVQSQISQLSNDINLRVQKGDVINQINVSTEGILIDGKKVHITGQTTIDNAVIKDAMIDSMTANKLTAGTIDANVITVKNINASNIVTGTLDASKATVANIDASKITTGTLSAARIAAGTIDASKLNVSSLSAISANLGNVTAGNISGVNIYGGSITQSSSGQNIWLDQNGFHMQANKLDIWMNNGRGLEVLYNNESKFRIDPNGNLTANDGTFIGNVGSVSDNYKMGTEMFSGGLYTVYSSSGSELSFTGEYDSGLITLRSYPINLQFNKSNIYESIQKGAGQQNYEAQISASSINLWAFTKPGEYTSAKNFCIETGTEKTDIYSDGNIKVSSMYSDLKLEGGKIYLTPDEKVYLQGTLNIGNNVDLYWDYLNKWLMFSKGIKSGNILINGYHAIKSFDGGEIFLNNAGTGYVDLTVKALHQASRWELKENFEVMDPEVALKNIIDTDVVRYNFKGESEVHVGLVIDDRDDPEYHACSDFITPNRQSKKDDTIVGELMLATKALNNYINNHNERLSIVEEQNKNLLLKIANLESRLAKLEA